MPRKVSHGLDYDEDYDEYDDYDYYDNDYYVEEKVTEKTHAIKEETKGQKLWRCPICTYDNEDSFSVCDICGVLRNPLVNNRNTPDDRTVESICKDSGVSKMAKSLFASLPNQIPKRAVKFQEQDDKIVEEREENIHKIGNIRGHLHEFHNAFSTCSHFRTTIVPFKFDIPSPDDVVSNGLRSSKVGLKVSHNDFNSSILSSDITKKSANNAALTSKSVHSSSTVLPTSKSGSIGHTQSSTKNSDNSGTSFGKSTMVIKEHNTSISVTKNLQPRDNRSSSTSTSKSAGKFDGMDESRNPPVEWEKPQSLAGGLNNMVLNVKSAYENYINGLGKSSNVQYKHDKWMLPDKGLDALTQLNLAIVGHVDSGKSTLSGRLLHLLGRVSQKEMHKYEKEAKSLGKGSFAYAWALDESAEERERGITMTVGVAYFDSKRYHVVVLDSPGHKDFVPNLISGATQADAAVLVIDASVGAFEAGMDGSKGQTREHVQLIRSFGVDQIIVAVNKMDVVGYSKDRYEFIKHQLGTFIRSCGYKDSSLSWIPLSAMANQNLVTAPSDVQFLSWYRGPNLLEAIDSLQPPTREYSKPLLMPICDVVRSLSLGQVSAIGKLEAGALQSGSKVLIMPSGDKATVRTLERNSQACKIARAGDNVTVTLQGVEASSVMAGGVLCHPDFPVAVAKHLELKVLTLEFATPILIGSQLEIHIHHVKEAARVARIVSLLDSKTGKVTKKAPRCLSAKQSAVIEVVLQSPVCVEAFSTSRALGRVFLRAMGRTIAVGIVTQLIGGSE
ncbi:HBS1-like protein isoform X2 [Benincasa hispida]|uniref:HBS1-like protein isoform X2 n=1 Tax=Benincasa hispida TaxID=102211 RepID=UPI0018FF733C|nr:HBS1-like protein isoform X2 [Benincasa hispida]